MYIYAIADIHGCYDQLLVLLAKIKYHSGSRPYKVIFLGDYVDRGPRSREVVNQIRGLVTGRGGHGFWKALKGNHEQMMIEGVTKKYDSFWDENGGKETRSSYTGYEGDMLKDAHWLDSLPTYIETDNHIFVHAGLSPRYLIPDQPDEVRLWIRNWEKDEHDFGKHVVYGHTPFKEPKLLTYSSGLDTGACFGGPLVAGVFDETKNSGPIEILKAL